MTSPEEYAVITARSGGSVAFLTQTLLSLLGIVLHFWTALRVVQLGGGVLLSIMALFLPGVSEIVLSAVFCWTRNWRNPYCLALLAYGGLMLVNWLSFVLLSRSSDSEE
jgi:hypothetical protein